MKRASFATGSLLVILAGASSWATEPTKNKPATPPPMNTVSATSNSPGNSAPKNQPASAKSPASSVATNPTGGPATAAQCTQVISQLKPAGEKCLQIKSASARQQCFQNAPQSVGVNQTVMNSCDSQGKLASLKNQLNAQAKQMYPNQPAPIGGPNNGGQSTNVQNGMPPSGNMTTMNNGPTGPNGVVNNGPAAGTNGMTNGPSGPNGVVNNGPAGTNGMTNGPTGPNGVVNNGPVSSNAGPSRGIANTTTTPNGAGSTAPNGANGAPNTGPNGH